MEDRNSNPILPSTLYKNKRLKKAQARAASLNESSVLCISDSMLRILLTCYLCLKKNPCVHQSPVLVMVQLDGNI